MEYRIHTGGIHKKMSNRHVANLQKLGNNLTVLLEDEPEDRRRSLQRCFLLKQILLLMNSFIEEEQRLSALQLLLEAIRLSPLGVLSQAYLVNFVKIVLPADVVRLIEKLTGSSRYE